MVIREQRFSFNEGLQVLGIVLDQDLHCVPASLVDPLSTSNSDPGGKP